MHIDYHNPSPNHSWAQYWSLGVLSALLEWPYHAWALLCHPCPLCTICAGLSLCLSLFWQVQQDRTCVEPSRAGITHHPLIGFVPPPIHLTSDILTIFSWNVIDFSSFGAYMHPIWPPTTPIIVYLGDPIIIWPQSIIHLPVLIQQLQFFINFINFSSFCACVHPFWLPPPTWGCHHPP